MEKINVLGTEISYYQHNENDFICLTDMVKNIENGLVLIEKWLRNKNTIEFLGVWEEIYNPDFNSPEFEGIKNQAGLNRFTLSVKQWAETDITVRKRCLYSTYYFDFDLLNEIGFLDDEMIKMLEEMKIFAENELKERKEAKNEKRGS